MPRYSNRFATFVLAAVAALAVGCGSRDIGEPVGAASPDAGPDVGEDSGVELIERRLLFGNPERTQARLSPDASMMSFLAPRDGVMNIWVAPTGEFEQARPLTNDANRGIQQHFWMPNGRHIAYLQDKGGNENWHIYAVDVATGESRDLTPLPDGSRATIYAASPRHPDLMAIGTNQRTGALFDPFLLNVVTGEMTSLGENPGFANYDFDEDLQIGLASRQTPGGDNEFLRPAEDGWEPVWQIPQADVINSRTLFFTADGSGIYVLSSVGRNTAALYLLDLETGGLELLADDDRADIDAVLSHPTTNEIQAFNVEYTRSEWEPLSEEAATDLTLLADRLSGDLTITSQSRDDRYWMVAEDDAPRPLRYHLFDREKKEVTLLFVSRPALADAPLVDMQPLVLEARDGLALVSYLSLPRGSDADGDGRPEQPQAMVLFVHGGPWARDSYGYDTIHQWLANRGYAVLSVNYRGSTGFGKDFVEAATHEFAGKMHDDLIDAVNWAVENGVAREDRVAIMGGSYGGYATLVGLTFTPETFACGVDIVGPSNLVTLIESFPDYWGPLLEGSWYSRVGDPRNEEGRARLEAASPLFRADEIVRPLLIGQGGNDPRVTKLESDQLTEVMIDNGQQVTYINYGDEGHGFARPENRDSFFAISEAFLSGCLGGRYQPLDGAFEGSSTEVLAGVEHVPGLAEALEGFEPVLKQ
jgi:dipeptidyl aminopeptidase/acylaminoacyl peptidase